MQYRSILLYLQKFPSHYHHIRFFFTHPVSNSSPKFFLCLFIVRFEHESRTVHKEKCRKTNNNQNHHLYRWIRSKYNREPYYSRKGKERMIEQHWQQKSDAAGKYLYRTWDILEEKVSGYFARMEESKTEN